MDKIFDNALPIGRIIMGAYFALAGLSKIATIGAAGLSGFIASKIPALAFMAWPVILFEVLAGLALIVGFKTRYTALALAIFCLFTGVVFHGTADSQGMMKNIALFGGYLVLAGVGSGKWAMDNKV